MKQNFYTILALITISGCAKPEITGTWVQPIPGMESEYQGITLFPDGRAQSVNMHTLLYQGWEQNGNYITVYGLSIGNGMIGHFNEMYEIKTLTHDTLYLWNENVPQTYTRQK